MLYLLLIFHYNMNKTIKINFVKILENKMKITIMIDSFKGSISSLVAGNQIKKTILKKHPEYEIKVLALADGGEGTVDALSESVDAKTYTVTVHGPSMNLVEAKYIITGKENTAVMEMSQASGINLICGEKNPFKATTIGVGEMIKNALDRGIRDFIIGIGGSATNDAGYGMLKALGVKFLDGNGNEIEDGPVGFEKLETINIDNLDERILDSRISIACDVKNPLLGENGASYIYGPQKGASEKDVVILDALLKKFHEKTLKLHGNSDENYPGAGAAGGLGYAFLNYLNAELKPGVELILQMSGAENFIKDSDLVITGEGKLDSQTGNGKAPAGVAALAKKYGKKVIAFSGIVDNSALSLNDQGIDAFFPILDKLQDQNEAMAEKKTLENLDRCVSQVFNLLDFKLGE